MLEAEIEYSIICRRHSEQRDTSLNIPLSLNHVTKVTHMKGFEIKTNNRVIAQFQLRTVLDQDIYNVDFYNAELSAFNAIMTDLCKEVLTVTAENSFIPALCHKIIALGQVHYLSSPLELKKVDDCLATRAPETAVELLSLHQRYGQFTGLPTDKVQGSREKTAYNEACRILQNYLAWRICIFGFEIGIFTWRHHVPLVTTVLQQSKQGDTSSQTVSNLMGSLLSQQSSSPAFHKDSTLYRRIMFIAQMNNIEMKQEQVAGSREFRLSCSR